MRRSRERRLRAVTWGAVVLNLIGAGVHAWHYGAGGLAWHGPLAVGHLALVGLLLPVKRRVY